VTIEITHGDGIRKREQVCRARSGLEGAVAGAQKRVEVLVAAPQDQVGIAVAVEVADGNGSHRKTRRETSARGGQELAKVARIVEKDVHTMLIEGVVPRHGN